MDIGTVIKIITLVSPLIEDLITRGVSKKKTDPYKQAAKSADTVMQSQQDLAIKIKQSQDPLDIKNFKSSVEITETMLKGYLERLEFNKKLSGVYGSENVVQ